MNQNATVNTLNVPDINTISLSGRSVMDPDLKQTNSGKAVCRFRFAYNPPKNAEQRQAEQNGQQPENNSVYYDVELWDKLATFIGERVRKGSPLIVHGSLHVSNWTDKTTGEQKQKTYIKAHKIDVLRLEDVRNGATHQGQSQYAQQAPQHQGPPQGYTQAPPQYTQAPAGHQQTYQQPIPNDDFPF